MTEGVTHYYYTQDAKHKNGTRFFMTTYTPEALERLELLEETPLFKENMKTLRDESRELAMECGCEDRAMVETFEDMGMSMTFNQWKIHQYITGMCRENILKGYHDRSIDTFAYYFTEYQNDGHPLGRERAIKERDEIIQKKKALEKEVEEVENSQTSIDIMKKENQKLKEDNEKLKKKKEITRIIINDLRKKDEDREKVLNSIVDMVGEDEILKHFDVECIDGYINRYQLKLSDIWWLMECKFIPLMKKREKKLMEFKELIEAVWLELYEKDKYNCETSFKDIAELTDYETNLTKIKELYESINPS